MVTAVASALYSFWFLTLPRKAWVYVMQTVKKKLEYLGIGYARSTQTS